MLTKDLLRVSRAGGGYRPQFVGPEHRPLAARTFGVFQGHVGEPRSELEAALSELEREAEDFKLVRGLASLLERDAEFETRAPLPPRRVRQTAFEAAEAVSVATEPERAEAVGQAADTLGVDRETVEASLYADRESNQVLDTFDPRWDPDSLLEQYNLSLAQTALFDATTVSVRSEDPKGLVSAVKRLGLMYEVVPTEDGREVVVTGPDSLFRHTRRYGTSFARLLRSVATASDWRLRATVDDRGRERELELTGAVLTVPGVEPVAEPTYDSDVEAEFAARFGGLDIDWRLRREPEPLAAGNRVMIPDFAFEYEHAEFTVFFEIMGFWTPEYVEKKLDQLATVEDVDMLVAVDESLGVGEEIEARDHRAIPYSGSVRVKPVVDALREYEDDLVADAAASLPSELVPEADVVSLESVAEDRDVSEDALAAVAFPEHERVGRTLVRSSALEAIEADLEPGMALSEAESKLEEHGIDDASSLLSALGYRVEWDGLAGGTLRARDA